MTEFSHLAHTSAELLYTQLRLQFPALRGRETARPMKKIDTIVRSRLRLCGAAVINIDDAVAAGLNIPA